MGTGGFGTRPYGFKLRSINAVGAATPGGPRFDDIRRQMIGITLHIFRRGGPMCPPAFAVSISAA